MTRTWTDLRNADLDMLEKELTGPRYQKVREFCGLGKCDRDRQRRSRLTPFGDVRESHFGYGDHFIVVDKSDHKHRTRQIRGKRIEDLNRDVTVMGRRETHGRNLWTGEPLTDEDVEVYDVPLNRSEIDFIHRLFTTLEEINKDAPKHFSHANSHV